MNKQIYPLLIAQFLCAFANLIKAEGAGLLLLNVEPLLAYCIVGMSAANYSPAKFSILPIRICTPTQEHVDVAAFRSKVIEFAKQMGKFFTIPRSRFAMLGGSLFWATAATLRVIIVAWAPPPSPENRQIWWRILKKVREISKMTSR